MMQNIFLNLLFSVNLLNISNMPPTWIENKIEEAFSFEEPTKLIALLDKGLPVNSLRDLELYKYSGYRCVTTLLTKAATNNKHKIISTLIARKGIVNKFDINGYTPLFYAAINSQENAALALLCPGADVHVITPVLYTPLMAACHRKSSTIVKMLLAAGAIKSHDLKSKKSINLRSQTALTALEVAKEKHGLAHYKHDPHLITLLENQITQWEQYSALKPAIIELFKKNILYGKQDDGTLVELPSLTPKIITKLIKYMQPCYDLDFRLDQQVVADIKTRLGVQKLPYWIEKAAQ